MPFSVVECIWWLYTLGTLPDPSWLQPYLVNMMGVLGGEVVGECTIYYWDRTTLADHLHGITVDAVGQYEILGARRLVRAKCLSYTLEINCFAVIWIGARSVQPNACKDVSVTIVGFKHRIRIVTSITIVTEIPDI